MNRFLAVTAAIEAAAGLGLVALPDVVVKLLLGADIAGAAFPLGRVAGVALLALGLASWLSRAHAANALAAQCCSTLRRGACPRNGRRRLRDDRRPFVACDCVARGDDGLELDDALARNPCGSRECR